VASHEYSKRVDVPTGDKEDNRILLNACLGKASLRG